MILVMFISEIERLEREETFLQNAKNKHGKRFDYSKVYYTNNITKIIIICKEHGPFTQAPAKHLSHKHACPKCAKIAQGLSSRIDKATLIKQGFRLYGDKYNYDDTVVGRKKDSIKIYCNIHKQYFSQMLGSHLNGHIGCKDCLRDKKEEQAHEIFKRNFIRQFTAKFGDFYDFSKVVYINNNTPVLVKCKKHNTEFYQVHRNIRRTPTCSCPECKKKYRISNLTSP